MTAHFTDVAIIGAGPVGLFAVFQCGMLRMRCHVIDALDAVGGQCTALYPEKPIYDIPGFPAIDASQLIDRLVEQAAPFAPTYHLGQRVNDLVCEDDGHIWRLETSAGTVIRAKAVMIAGGVGAFGPNRPPLAGLADYEGSSVFYAVQRKADLAGKQVVIAGGGDSAVDWAVALADIARHVYLVHRRPKFRAAPESVARAEALAAAGRIEMVIPYQLAGLEGADGRLSGVTVATLDGETRRLEADVLLAFFGLSMDLGPMQDWGIDLEKSHIRADPATCQTNLGGIYAIGDIATYPGKLKLILTGFSEAAMAAHAAFPRVHPDEILHFEHSTTTGIPAAA
ncbi:MAG: NAD(P)/FAD-dependent oxidoreductase [Rhodospirillaceae bacterium]|nr:NAD(P)/FAD-dependent oxidoreductase [Rhodospirillaceae bacterium]